MKQFVFAPADGWLNGGHHPCGLRKAVKQATGTMCFVYENGQLIKALDVTHLIHMHTPLDWIRDNSVLLMYGHDYDLLAAKDVYEELSRWEQWYSSEQQRIEKEYPEIDPMKERRYSGTLMEARQLAWKRVQEQASIYLDEIAFKALAGAVC